MNKNSQESESKPIFKRRLKRFDKITDDEDKVPNSAGVSKNNTLQEKLMETANGDIEETSEPKTAFSSKVQNAIQADDRSGSDSHGENGFQIKRIKRRITKKVKPNYQEESSFGANSQPVDEGEHIIVSEDGNENAAGSGGRRSKRKIDPEDEDFSIDDNLQKMKKKIMKKGLDAYSAGDADDEEIDDKISPKQKTKHRKIKDKGKKVNFEKLSNESGDFKMSDNDEQDYPERGPKKKVKKAKTEKNSRNKMISSESLANMNRVKTTNKLIGDIANNDLYRSDEDLLDGFGGQGASKSGMNNGDDSDENYQGKDIEIDFSKNVTKKTDGKAVSFLANFKDKKEKQELSMGVEQDIINMGVVSTLAKKVSANQLAASGIQLSMRENLIKFISQMDKEKITNKEQQLLDVLKNSSQGTLIGANQIDETILVEELPNIVDPAATKVDIQTDSTFVEPAEVQPILEENADEIKQVPEPAQIVDKLLAIAENQNQLEDNEEEEEGLEFYDPEQEAKELKALKQLEENRNRKIQKLDMNNKQALKRAATGHVAAQNIKQGNGNNQRSNMFKMLKEQKMQKLSRNLTFDHVKKTFQTTGLESLNSTKKKKQYTAVGVDGKEVLLHAEDESENDSEYLGEDGEKVDAAPNVAEQAEECQVWDDEENFVEDNIDAEVDDNEEEGEDEQMSKQNKSEKLEPAMSVNESEDRVSISAPRRLKKTKTSRSVSSHASNATNKSRKSRKQNIVIKKTQVAEFFEDQAELGSDNEDGDDARRMIDKDDIEENEDGLDSDLDGFIDHTNGREEQNLGDDEEIEDLEDAARNAYLMDIHNDDKMRTKIAMEAAIYGRNKKRKRQDADIEDEQAELDEYERRKLDRIKEREQIINSQEEEQMEQQLLEGGKERVLEAQRLKELQDEEEMSEDEIRQQVDYNKYYQFLQKKNKKDTLRDIDAREKKMEEELNNELKGLQKSKTVTVKMLNKLAINTNNQSQKKEQVTHNPRDKKSREVTDQIEVQIQEKLPQPVNRGFKKMNTTIGKMIDKKQILHNLPMNNVQPSFNFGSRDQSKKKGSISPLKGGAAELKKKSYGGGSMINFFKNKDTNGIDSNNMKKTLIAQQKNAVPMMFKQQRKGK